jgi:hypothetical protein
MESSEASEPSEPSPPPSTKQRWIERIRSWGLPAALLTGAAIFLVSVNHHYPIRHWLFWRYAAYWCWSALFAAACLSGGHLVLQRVLRQRLRLDQHLMFAFATGVLLFHLGMVAGGVLQLFGWVFSLIWPLGLVGAGGPSLVAHLRPRVTRLWRHAERQTPRQRLGLACLAAFGIAGVGMLYFLILTPDNIAYDARWYHLPLAEQYAVHGGIRRFEEGWYQSTFPHLSSFLYSWAFQVPGTILFDRLELAPTSSSCCSWPRWRASLCWCAG